MLVDRLIIVTQQGSRRIIFKYILHSICAIALHLVVFGHTVVAVRNPNIYIKIFYLLYSGYLLIGCAQIR